MKVRNVEGGPASRLLLDCWGGNRAKVPEFLALVLWQYTAPPVPRLRATN